MSMLVCPKCGNENPLGRVFCVTCGSKLDLTRMSSEVVQEAVKRSWFAMHWPKLIYAVLVLVLLLVAMALWPNTKPLGEQSAAIKGEQLLRQMERVRILLQPNKPLSLPMVDKDINAALAIKAKKWGVSSVSIDIANDYFTVHVVNSMFGVSVPGTERRFTPEYSYTLVCVPSGNAVRVGKVTFGHLSMKGPLRNMVVGRFARMLAQEKEWELVRSVRSLKAEKGKLTVVFGK